MTVISSATTTSYPAVGVGGLNETEWAEMNNAPDGIVEDYAGNAFGLSRLTNVARITPATTGATLCRVNGYQLKISGNEDLTCAAVTTGSKTYIIAVQYDPALNVADGSGNATALGPCRLIITDAALDTTGGKKYFVLYSFVRSAGQAMTDVTIADHRKWSGPIIEWSTAQGNPPAGGEANFPRGSVRWDANREAFLIRTMKDDQSALEWRLWQPTDPLPFPAPGALVALDAPAEMWKNGNVVHLRGTLRRSSGANLNTGAEVVLGTLPVGWRPVRIHRFACLGSGPNFLGVKVTSDGVVTMYDPVGSVSVAYVQLDTISFRAEN